MKTLVLYVIGFTAGLVGIASVLDMAATYGSGRPHPSV